MWIGGIILIIALMAGTYYVAGDAFKTDDYVNTLTMLGAFAVISITVFVALKYVNQIKNDTAGGELAEENWDGIGEYKNPVPSGWGLAYIGTLIWLFWYWFVGYPTNGFSQIGQYNEEVNEYNGKFAAKFQNIDENGLRAMGESVFLVQCAPCHGADAEGIDGKAQDLTHRIAKASILYTIEHGANNFKDTYPGGMPAGMASGADAEKIAEYVAGGFKGTKPASWATCAGCHGEDGSGIPGVAPNLRTYTDDFVATVLRNGKKSNIGTMPSFAQRLNETQIKAVATYLRSIGE
jgi:cytochrome c oxidase cbb3-type subunit 3